MSRLKVYLDDERSTPEGWRRVFRGLRLFNDLHEHARDNVQSFKMRVATESLIIRIRRLSGPIIRSQ